MNPLGTTTELPPTFQLFSEPHEPLRLQALISSSGELTCSASLSCSNFTNVS